MYYIACHWWDPFRFTIIAFLQENICYEIFEI